MFTYFFLTGLSLLAPHFRHFTLPDKTFNTGAFILDLHTLQTNTFLKSLASASGNFDIIITKFMFFTPISVSTALSATQ